MTEQISLWDQASRIEEAFRQQYSDLWAIDVFDDKLITLFSGLYYEIGYREVDDVLVFDTLAQWVEVEKNPKWEVKAATQAGELLVLQGGQIKALGNGKVGGLLVKFSDADSPDLLGDYFDAQTEFALVKPQTSVYYNHGLDPFVGKSAIGEGSLEIQDVGVWIEATLEMRNDYERAIYGMVEGEKMGWSSGTAPNLVSVDRSGKANHITQWPLGLDASLTPTPAEPSNVAMPLKTYAKLTQDLQALLKGMGDILTDAKGLSDLTPDNELWLLRARMRNL